MSYYILPKNNNVITINPNINSEIIIHSSQSLYYFYNILRTRIDNLLELDKTFNIVDNLSKAINPYEYIFSKVPGSKFSVSKLKPITNLFYDCLEIISTMNIFENYKLMTIKSIHIGNNYLDSQECFELIRENQNDEYYCSNELDENFYKIINDITEKYSDKRVNIIFYEIHKDKFHKDNLNLYFIELLEILKIVLKHQCDNGICIIKIDSVFYKPIIDILYIFSSLYEKTYIIKPNTSNITSFEKFIVCKNFFLDDVKIEIYKNYYNTICQFINDFHINSELNQNQIVSIMEGDVPYYFMNKINDMNNIIGQQQLESMDQLINIIKSKNRDDKLESFRKTNIQKSVNWCEKYKIPCNKFSEKTNIFLPVVRPEDEEEFVEEEIVNSDNRITLKDYEDSV